MSGADDPRKRLSRELDAFEASRAGKPSVIGGTEQASDGYRLLAGLIGGVLGGLGLGWTFDHFAHTSPFGLISGLLIGLGISMYTAVRSALAMSAKASAGKPLPPAVADDEDED